MYIILGINHARVVGIDKTSGKPFDFDPMNVGSYREPKNEKEDAKILLAAMEYYNECTDKVKEGPFGILKITREEVDKLIEHPELSRLYTEVVRPSKSCFVLRPCRYCGEYFIPVSPRQRVCEKKECQTNRRTDVMRRYRENKARR